MSWLHDPLTDRTVRIAAGRADRPNDFVDAEAARRCPFCLGSESDTPTEIDRIEDAAGEWLTRVVPNRYPVVEGDAGAHEVVIESPRHVRRFVELTDAEAAAAVSAWVRRLAHWQSDTRFDYTLLFKNEGPAAGASLEHVHSQVLALPEAPAGVAAMWDRLIDAAGRTNDRAVAEQDGWRITCPPAPRAELETWIRPAAGGSLLDASQASSLAAVLLRVLRALGDIPFNVVLQIPPSGLRQQAIGLGWIEIIPRTSAIAGFELATGRWINAVAPEAAVERLKQRLG